MTEIKIVKKVQEYVKTFSEEKYEYFTPEDARNILAKDSFNPRYPNDPGGKRINQNQVDKYIHLIESEQWKPELFNAVIIDENGKILDGHHRLNAVAQSKNGAYLRVIRGVSRSFTKHLIDTNQYSRTPAQAAGVSPVECATYNAITKYANRKNNPNKVASLSAIQLQALSESNIKDLYNKAEAVIVKSISNVKSIDQNPAMIKIFQNAVFKASILLGLYNGCKEDSLIKLLSSALNENDLQNIDSQFRACRKKITSLTSKRRNSEAERQEFTRSLETALHSYQNNLNPENARHDRVKWNVPLIGYSKIINEVDTEE